MKKLLIGSPAKINLHLQVIRKRPDGFHDISTAFQLIDLFDELSFEVTSGNIELEQEPYPIEDNLVLKAARELKEFTQTGQGAKILLKKKIPVLKGLGGGSSNAATTLVVLNKMWETQLSYEQLVQIGSSLGSDIPFFIYGKNAWAQGRGEILQPIELKPRYFILVFPVTEISTKKAFQNIKVQDENIVSLDDFQKGITKNSFTDWVRQTYIEIDELFNELEEIGEARLTGTGSAIFVAFNDKEEATRNLSKFPQSILVKSIDHSPLMQLIE